MTPNSKKQNGNQLSQPLGNHPGKAGKADVVSGGLPTPFKGWDTSTPPAGIPIGIAEKKKREALNTMMRILAEARDVPFSDLWVVEWSQAQGCQHIEPISAARRCFPIRWSKPGLGWETVGYAGSHEGAHEYADAWAIYTGNEDWFEKRMNRSFRT